MSERPYMMDRGEHVMFGALSFGASYDATSAGGAAMLHPPITASIGAQTAILPFNGYAVGIGVNLDTALAGAESLTVKLRKGATAVYTTTLTSGTQSFSTQFTPTEVTYAAGDKLSILCTHAALTTAIVGADVWIAHRSNTL